MPAQNNHTTVALYFVASPLQYLAARRIAQTHEPGAKQVLVWYKPGVATVVQTSEWDVTGYMPWPRWEPLPGWFGRLRRQRANLRLVANWVGPCETLHIHSAVFDTEAINYFLRALPQLCGASTMHARILPDGVISTQRYPLSWLKRLVQHTRRLRRWVAPELDYWCFSGDRIGSDAPFCDRIYVLPGLPHEYPPQKTVTLPPLVTPSTHTTAPDIAKRRALVIGQPLAGAGLTSTTDSQHITRDINQWLQNHRFEEIYYKQHPKDPNKELWHAGYNELHGNEPLEEHLANTHYDAIVGVRSSALLFARQIYPKTTRILSLGWSKVRFKSRKEKTAMLETFQNAGIEIIEAST